MSDFILLYFLHSFQKYQSDMAFRMLSSGRADLMAQAVTLLGPPGVNAANDQGISPLMFAAIQGEADVVALLINAGKGVCVCVYVCMCVCVYVCVCMCVCMCVCVYRHSSFFLLFRSIFQVRGPLGVGPGAAAPRAHRLIWHSTHTHTHIHTHTPGPPRTHPHPFHLIKYPSFFQTGLQKPNIINDKSKRIIMIVAEPDFHQQRKKMEKLCLLHFTNSYVVRTVIYLAPLFSGLVSAVKVSLMGNG